MTKYYFDLDKVSSISYKLEEKSEYKWYDEIKPQRRYFLGLPIGWTEGKIEGWSYYSNGEDRTSPQFFDDYKHYRVDLVTKEVFIRPRVTVFLGYKDSYTSYFDTDHQAQAYVNELVAKSKKNFQVIIEK
jgi:hypothetical protein